MFSFTFLCKFLRICYFAIFVQIFMKFLPKWKTKKLEMIYIHHFGKFLLIFELGKDPISGLGKFLNGDNHIQNVHVGRWYIVK